MAIPEFKPAKRRMEDFGKRYEKISKIVFDPKKPLDLNSQEAIVLALVNDMGRHGTITREKAKEIQELILEIISEPPLKNE